jgi:hypothetical protein
MKKRKETAAERRRYLAEQKAGEAYQRKEAAKERREVARFLSEQRRGERIEKRQAATQKREAWRDTIARIIAAQDTEVTRALYDVFSPVGAKDILLTTLSFSEFPSYSPDENESEVCFTFLGTRDGALLAIERFVSEDEAVLSGVDLERTPEKSATESFWRPIFDNEIFDGHRGVGSVAKYRANRRDKRGVARDLLRGGGYVARERKPRKPLTDAQKEKKAANKRFSLATLRESLAMAKEVGRNTDALEAKIKAITGDRASQRKRYKEKMRSEGKTIPRGNRTEQSRRYRERKKK